MNLNKANLSVSKVASKDSSRFEIQGIRIEKGYTVGTDGFRAAIVTFPHQIPLDEIPKEVKTDAMGRFKPCTIANDKIDVSKLSKGKRSFFTFDNQVFVDVEESNKNGSVQFETLNHDFNVKTNPVKKQNESFPDVFNVFPPEDRHVHKHTVNIDLLIGLLQVAKEVSKIVEISFPEFHEEYGENMKNVIELHNTSMTDNKQEFYGLIMPIRE